MQEGGEEKMEAEPEKPTAADAAPEETKEIKRTKW